MKWFVIIAMLSACTAPLTLEQSIDLAVKEAMQ